MNRIVKHLCLALSAIVMAGCASSSYDPKAADTQLASYAGQAVFPSKLTAVESPHIFCSVAPDATITLYNAGDDAYNGFELWVNGLYTLHVEKLDARDEVTIDPKTLYNKVGANLQGVPANSINTVQIYYQDKLYTIQGPIIKH